MGWDVAYGVLGGVALGDVCDWGFADAQGVLIRRWFRARRFRWCDIARFEIRRVRVLVTNSDFKEQIWLVPKSGRPAATGFIETEREYWVGRKRIRRSLILMGHELQDKLAALNALPAEQRRR